MKKTIILVIYTVLLLCSAAYGSPECMSFGHNPYADDNDYHTLHYVECHCPCKQYKRLPRGQCSYCSHYRYIDELKINDDKKLLQKQLPYKKSDKIPQNVVDKNLYKIFGKYYHFNPETERFIPILE